MKSNSSFFSNKERVLLIFTSLSISAHLLFIAFTKKQILLFFLLGPQPKQSSLPIFYVLHNSSCLTSTSAISSPRIHK